jgi:hypothetical protein
MLYLKSPQFVFFYFNIWLTLLLKVGLVTGDTENREGLHLVLDEFDVLVMTPKVLENNLGPDKIPSLSIFSLIMFDECHNTRKGEPYNSLMKKYLESKKKGEKDLPQVSQCWYCQTCSCLLKATCLEQPVPLDLCCLQRIF